MKILEESDACFKGPTTTIPIPGAPRSVAVTLRQKFELYSNIRPTKTYDRLTPNRKLDCVCFREATEGLYTGIEAQITEDSAIAIRKITRQGCDRFLNSAMKWAKEYNMKKMVAITKRNILKQTDGIFWSSSQKAVEGTDVELSEIYIDNMAQQMVVAPEQFNGSILVSTNLFMDIISELASGLVGSIGLIYSANMGDSFAMFEAAHGSAPQFAGQNKVNPTATVLSGAWMAQYLGETEIRDAIFSATDQVINEGKTVTWDIGGNASTTQMTDAIIVYAKEKLRK
jgi:isocitrate dehydrogenase